MSVPSGSLGSIESIRIFRVTDTARRTCEVVAAILLAERSRHSVIRVTAKATFFDSRCYFVPEGDQSGLLSRGLGA